VRITENGRGAYVFCSEEVFQQVVDDAVERALCMQRFSDAIDRGRADISAGRYVDDIEAAKAAVADRRATRGTA
jgi:predicted transcriptional regulator